MHAVALGLALQTVKIETRHIQVFGSLCNGQGVQSSQRAGLQVLPDERAVARFEKLAQSLVPETFNHI